jgi:hypothetical protein
MERSAKDMKKVLAITLLVILSLSGSVWAVGTDVQKMQCSDGKTQCVVTITWVAHTDGTWTSRAITASYIASLQDMYLYEMETDPGSPAPASYGVTILRANTGFSYDVLGGRGASRSATVTEGVLPANTTGSRYPGVAKGDTWTLGISGATNSGATGVIRLWFVK